jgi:hypothetical protein
MLLREIHGLLLFRVLSLYCTLPTIRGWVHVQAATLVAREKVPQIKNDDLGEARIAYQQDKYLSTV